MHHVARGSIVSPYISCSRSFGVARAYGIVGPKGFASAGRPGYVYEIEVSDDRICRTLDPVKEVAEHLRMPWEDPPYQHDGTQRFLLGVVDRVTMLNCLQETCIFPPGSEGGTPRTPNLSQEVECLVRALRDAEVLVLGNVPASIVRNKYEVY
jgi:hypothetical protein